MAWATCGIGSPGTFVSSHGDAIVDVGHEFVEVGAPLRFERRLFEEEIHQHRLAASDGAPDVKPPRRGGSLPKRRETRRFCFR